jgi:hypothetical protein
MWFFRRYGAAVECFFLALSSVAGDSQLFFFEWTHVVFWARSDKVFFSESDDVLKIIVWFIAD